MIQVNQVSKSFLTIKALSDCRVTFEQGKITGVIGENGSGKTTLLKIIAGLLKPTKGTVLIDGKHVTRRICQRLAFLHDQDYFYWYFTVGELIRYYDAVYDDFNKEKAETMLLFMNLREGQKINHLSKGNLTRLKMVVTLARDVPYIILDEPFLGLDPMVRKSIIKSMLQFIDLSKQTLIMSTHEVNEVDLILDDVVLLKRGQVIAHQSIEKIREYEQKDVVTWMEDMYQSV